MAEIDTTGRTARSGVGKARVSSTGGATVNGALCFSEHGLAPSADHGGAGTAHRTGGKKHLDGVPLLQAHPQGKRQVNVVHESGDIDVRKRLAGKFGLRKVAVVHQEPKTHTLKGGAGMKSMTAEQHARNRIKEAAKHVDPSVLGNVSVEQLRGEDVFRVEQRVVREVNIAEAAALRKAVESASPAKNRNPSTQPSSVAPPFATSDSRGPLAFHPMRRRLDGPKTVEHFHQGKLMHESRRDPVAVPFDTVSTCETYPDPPAVGLSDAAALKHRSKRVIVAPTNNSDVDTANSQRALAHPPNKMMVCGEDYIFGNPSLPRRKGLAASSKRFSDGGLGLLEHTAVPTVHFPASEAPPNRHPQMYKKTALW